jgi:tetratricopeptide (TPR) repeat protein
MKIRIAWCWAVLLSRVQKIILHPTKDRWQTTDGRKNNGLRIRPCAKNAGKGLFALTSLLGVALLVTVDQGLAQNQNIPTPPPPSPSLAGPDRPEPPLRQESDRIPDWQAWLELARLQSYTGQYEASLDSYAHVLREKPDLIHARLEQAKVLNWAGRPEEAWAVINDLPEEGLDDETRLILADLLATRQEYDQAVDIYQAHLERRPRDHSTRLKLAETLSWAGHYPQSLDEYETLLQDQPDDIQLRRKYAFVLSWAGRHDDAIRELRRSLP